MKELRPAYELRPHADVVASPEASTEARPWPIAAAPAGRSRAPETLLDLRDKARRTDRPAGRLASPQPDEGVGVGFAIEQVGEMRRAVDERLHADESVVAGEPRCARTLERGQFGRSGPARD